MLRSLTPPLMRTTTHPAGLSSRNADLLMPPVDLE
jgi:hypothetical protein